MLANNKGYDLSTENNNVRLDFAENRAYGLFDSNGEQIQDEKLKSGDLMNIARQIAAGMVSSIEIQFSFCPSISIHFKNPFQFAGISRQKQDCASRFGRQKCTRVRQ